MVKRILFGTLLIWGAVLLFMPTKSLYYKAETLLEKQGIKINESRIDERLFGLDLSGVEVFTKGIKVASVEQVSFRTFLVYTKIALHGVDIDVGVARMLPKDISDVILTYSLLAPMKILVEAKGAFGELQGEILLKARKVHIDFTKVDDIKSIESQLTKGEEGWFYETAF